MIPIILTLAARPQYAAQAIEGLRRCRGIGGCIILPHVDYVEGVAEEMRALVDAIDFAEVRPTFHTANIGPHANLRRAWRAGFDLGEYVALVEEDIVYAADALEYHQWARERFRGDSSVYSVTCYNRRPDPCPGDLHHQCRKRVWYHPWGVGTWRDRWYSLPAIDDACSNPGWDLHQHQQAVDVRGLSEVYPELSRCQNIGIFTSVQSDPTLTPEWYARNHFLQHWAGNHDVEEGEWSI